MLYALQEKKTIHTVPNILVSKLNHRKGMKETSGFGCHRTYNIFRGGDSLKLFDWSLHWTLILHNS